MTSTTGAGHVAALTRGRYAHIDALRAVAVMLVVVAHAGLGGLVPGGSGVTIFFCISGFVITASILREKERSGGFKVGSFYLRRALKLGPPFAVAIAAPTAAFTALGGDVSLFDFLAQVLFVFNWVYMQGDFAVLPGSGIVWSLAVEEQFYIAFAAIWLALVKMRSRHIAALGTIAAAGILIPLGIRMSLYFSSYSHERIYYGTDTRFDAIAIGIGTAALWWTIKLRPRASSVAASLALPLGAVGIFILSLLVRDDLFRETLRYTFQASAAALLILWGLADTESKLAGLVHRVSTWRPVRLVGLASYSIYLTHLIVVYGVESLFLQAEDWTTSGGLLGVALRSLLGVAAGLLLWRVVEVPVEQWKSQRKERTGE